METVHTFNPTHSRPLNFEEVVLPHLDAAYRLARSLTESGEDAQDIVQEAALRAFRYFRTFSGGNGRAWFLRIVRHLCYDDHGHKLKRAGDTFDEEKHTASELTPEMLLLHEDNVSLIEHAMTDLPERFRELLVLRELEGLSYQELADVLRIPIGSVMSRLSRARQALRRALAAELLRRERPASPAPRVYSPGAIHHSETQTGLSESYEAIHIRRRCPRSRHPGVNACPSADRGA
jgi:RNA polymerase sigma-70 factor, ECF subfamily